MEQFIRKDDIDRVMDLERALEYALDGDAILFVGAGFSLGAQNSRGPFKSGGAFAAHLSAKVSLPASTEIQDAAEAFVRSQGQPALNSELIIEFRATEVAKYHVSVARVPWRRVYTTNYDTVFELASSKAENIFRAVSLSEIPRDFDPGEHICVHLNGYVERLTSTSGDEIRLTDTSYITTSVDSSPWANALRADLSRAKSVFFVGYSLTDLDISRLLSSTDDLENKTFFIVGPTPTARTQTRASRYGTLQTFDTAWFGKQVETKRSRYTPPERTSPTWYCLEPFKSSFTDSTLVSDKALFELLLRGLVDRDLLANSLEGSSQPYVIRRSPLRTILEVCNDASKVVVIHSGLGNGKSILAESIKVLSASAGGKVYTLSKRSPSLVDELTCLASSEEPCLLVVDDYPSWLDALAFLGSNSIKNLRLLLTSRTGPHDILIDRLEELFVGRSIDEINIDKLDATELDNVNVLLQQYGLWGSKAGLATHQRIKHLKVHCRAEWQSILTELFEAPQMQARFEALLKTLDNRQGYYDIIVGILALTVLNERTTTDTLVDLFGSRVLDTNFQRDERIAELVDFRQGIVRHHSSVAAQFILRKVADPTLTVDVIANIARLVDKSLMADRIYAELMRRLVQFSQLETILPSRDLAERRAATFRYYERVKNLSYCNNNPQFWLQYAIAALVFEDFERSEKYFESAYSFASRLSTYDTHKIDNHYARLLLEKAARSDSKDIGMKLFRKARKIVFEQIQKERLHYPYRVANGIGEVFDTFAGVLSEAERQEIVNASQFIARRIEGLSPELQNNRYIIRCLATMKRIQSLSPAGTGTVLT